MSFLLKIQQPLRLVIFPPAILLHLHLLLYLLLYCHFHHLNLLTNAVLFQSMLQQFCILHFHTLHLLYLHLCLQNYHYYCLQTKYHHIQIITIINPFTVIIILIIALFSKRPLVRTATKQRLVNDKDSINNRNQKRLQHE